MKKHFLVSALFLLLIPCILSASIALGFSADGGVVQDIVIGNSSFNISADLRCEISRSFEIRLPINYVWNQSGGMADLGLNLHYYPFENLGLNIGLSLLQFGFTQPDTLFSNAGTDNSSSSLKNTFTLSEMLIGWRFIFFNGMFLEPSLVIRNPSGTFTDDYNLLKDTFPCYKTFRFKVFTGMMFRI